MKKQLLIGLSAAVFTLLFYDQYLGINVSIFAVWLLGLTWNKFPHLHRNLEGKFLISAVLISVLSFAWIPDFTSFLALTMSLLLLRIYAADPELKWFFSIGVFLVNLFATVFRIFLKEHWVEGELKNRSQYALKLLMYVLVPVVFLSGFVVIYVVNSDYLTMFFSSFEFDFNFFDLLFSIVLGLCISFAYWNCWILETVQNYNKNWKNTFSEEKRERLNGMITPIDVDLQRRSGEITLLLLNSVLVVFLVFYNYEQFFNSTSADSLSAQTHQGVNSIILSIVMAIGLLLFYFKGNFNFDAKAKRLKQLAYAWIVLNVIVIGSTLIKNIDYVMEMGLTYKRLGVFVFLFLCIAGLFFTRRKIKLQKTNFYLINRMSAVLFVTLLICGSFNWSGLITLYNLSQDKVDWSYLSRISRGNEYLLLDYLDKQPSRGYEMDRLIQRIAAEQCGSLLSRGLYYQCIPLSKFLEKNEDNKAVSTTPKQVDTTAETKD